MAAFREAVIVFAKFPRPGEVKTRLAASVGNVQAAAFYKHCAEAIIGELASLDSTTLYVFFSRGDDEAEVAAWLAPLKLANMRLAPQLQEPNLGARMQHALQYALNCGHQRVAIVGTDVPDLTSTVVASALHCLDTYQAVFGPAEDGGYYLLALTTLPSGLFQGISWSTSSVLAANVANAQQLGLSVAPLSTLEALLDIDTLPDLQRWCTLKQQQQSEQPLQARESRLLDAALCASACATIPAAQ
ncbi:hypothetical protein ACK3TF_001606 [Chlorella vulgaris]